MLCVENASIIITLTSKVEENMSCFYLFFFFLFLLGMFPLKKKKHVIKFRLLAF